MSNSQNSYIYTLPEVFWTTLFRLTSSQSHSQLMLLLLLLEQHIYHWIQYNFIIFSHSISATNE